MIKLLNLFLPLFFLCVFSNSLRAETYLHYDFKSERAKAYDGWDKWTHQEILDSEAKTAKKMIEDCSGRMRSPIAVAQAEDDFWSIILVSLCIGPNSPKMPYHFIVRYFKAFDSISPDQDLLDNATYAKNLKAAQNNLLSECEKTGGRLGTPHVIEGKPLTADKFKMDEALRDQKVIVAPCFQ